MSAKKRGRKTRMANRKRNASFESFSNVLVELLCDRYDISIDMLATGTLKCRRIKKD